MTEHNEELDWNDAGLDADDPILDTLLVSELEALVEHNEKEAWIADRMAEHYAGDGPEQSAEKATQQRDFATWHRARMRAFNELAARAATDKLPEGSP